MTKAERKKLRKAIALIHGGEGEGDYHAGMDIIAKLAGLDTSASEILERTRPTKINELARRGPNEFRVEGHTP